MVPAATKPLNIIEHGCPLPAFVSPAQKADKPGPEVGFWKLEARFALAADCGQMTSKPSVGFLGKSCRQSGSYRLAARI